jgi:hypothetical protein
MGGEAMASAKELLERLTIREIVENWALLRDARRWDRFRELWHEEGRMITIWIDSSFDEFIKASQAGYDKGVRFLHFLGGTTIDLKRIAPSLRRSRRSRIGSRSTAWYAMWSAPDASISF